METTELMELTTRETETYCRNLDDRPRRTTEITEIMERTETTETKKQPPERQKQNAETQMTGQEESQKYWK